MTDPVPMAQVWRGRFAESVHRGHAAICDTDGQILAAWGDPDKIILPRSSCKMLQSLPLLESGAGAYLSDERLALACGSHQGARMHVERVADWLCDEGLTEADLQCGPQRPVDRDERERLRAKGEPHTELHNNCSGKHAGFLALAKHLKSDPDYLEVAHPVQAAVRTAFEEMTGLESPGYAIDGCAAPNFATTIAGLARAMARMANPRGLGACRSAAAERLVTAMRAHPLLVAGVGRACSELIEASNRSVVAKTGAEGVFTAILPDRGLGVALKIEDGSTRGAECAIAAILLRLGAIAAQDPRVERRLRGPIKTRSGAIVGHIAPAPELWQNGAAL
ncbi:MAG: asparaginase [Pseudomonadota bacterium]